MAKQLNINMAFTADTSQAKKQIADLQTQLSNLMTSSATNTTDSFTNGIQDSIQSVAKLKMALSEATNTKTGIVDLSKFNQNLSDAGLSVEQLSTDMAALGPEGVQAFSNVASSIATMESPLKRTNQLLDSFWTALKNSARWQISSGVLHGLTSAVQGAYSYAQDLNKSLSNIAIVTGQNVSEMDAFAEKANKAAQALSVTTTAYTDASLIYYQQGLDDDEVDERTQTTLKMSNVTGESVDEVSSYMTAIWNNFADGSDNLELFADKITALGAATASSSEEIAEGIEQFASLGSTMGLSYDNATAALATVVAQTRQSASTVGNSMRTILQRFQSLSLGETLEDGVDLTDYTSALKTVGVEVLDANGELKDLDEIITDLGSAWQNLGDAERSALAGTVAGVRNSNTLIAWMDNFDKFQENLEVAANAEGSLDEQAEIYAQSWEGAQKRVKAAWQAIYSDIIDDDFFITLNNDLEGILKTVDRVIDGFGGLPALLTTIGTVFTSVFKNQISSGLSDMAYSISMMTPSGQKKQQEKDNQIRNEWAETNKNLLTNATSTGGTKRADAIIANLTNEKKVADAYNKNLDLMTDKQKELNKLSIELYKTEGKKVEQLAEEVDKEQEKLDLIKKQALTKARGDGSVEKVKKAQKEIEQAYNDYQEAVKGTENSDKTEDLEKRNKAYDTYQEKVLNAAVEGAGDNNEVLDKLVDYGNGLDSLREKTDAYDSAQKKATNDGEKIKEKFDTTSNSALDYGEAILAATSMIGGFVTSVNAVKSVFTILSDPDTSGWEKFCAVLTAAGTALGVLSTAFSENNKKLVENLIKTLAAVVGEKALAMSTEEVAAANWSWFESCMMLFPYFTLIVAAIGAVVLAVKSYLDTYNAALNNAKEASERLQEAKEGLEEITTAADEASSAYDSLCTAFNKLDEDPLEGLTEGTIEWKNAISDANDELLTALESAGVLEDAVLSYDENGLLQVDNEDELKESAYNKKIGARAAKYASQSVVYDKQGDSAIADGVSEFTNTVRELKSSFSNLNPAREDQDIIDKFADSTYNTSGQEKLANEFETTVRSLAENGVKLSTEEILANVDGQYDDILDQYGTSEEVIETIVNSTNQLIDAMQGKELSDEQLGEAYLESQGVDTSNLTSEEKQKVATSAGEDLTADAEEYVNSISDVTEIKKLYAKLMGDDYKYDEGTGNVLKGDEKIDTSVTLMRDELSAKVAKALATGEGKEYVNDAALKYGQTIANETADNVKKGIENSRSSAITDTNSILDGNNNISGSDVTLFEQQKDEDGDYKYTTEELEKFNEWLKTVDESTLKTASSVDDLYSQMQHAQETELSADDLDSDVDADTWEALSEYISDYADSIDGLSGDLKKCKAEAQKVAQAFLRFDDAIQDVNDNYEDWSEALETGNMADVAEAIVGMKDAYGDLLDIDGSTLSEDFLTDADNLELMKQAVEGNEDAYNQLQLAATKDYLIKMGIDSTEVDSWMNYISSLENSGYFANLEAGASINDEDFLNALTEMINATAATTAEAEEMLSRMGIDATVVEDTNYKRDVSTTNDIEAEATDEGSITVPVMASDGSTVEEQEVQLQGIKYHKVPTESEEAKEMTAYGLKIETAHKKAGGNIKHQNSSGSNKGSGSGNKGSGSGNKAGSKKKTKEHKKSSVKKDRYHNIKEKIEDTTDALDRLNDASDRAWGKSKLKLMDQAIEKQEKQIQLTKDYITEIKNYAKTDKDALSNTLRELGMSEAEITSQFDENGILKNYEALQNYIDAYYERGLATYNAAVDKYNSIVETYNNGDRTDSTAVDAAEEELEAAEDAFSKIEDKYDDYTEDLEQYEETMNLLQEKENDLIEQWNELYDSKLSKLTDTIELQFELNDDALDQAEWYLDALGDKAEKATDRIATLTKELELNKQKIENNKKAIADIFAFHGIEVDMNNFNADSVSNAVSAMLAKVQAGGMTVDMSTVMDNISDYRDNLMDAYDETEDIVEQIYENIADAFDDWNEKLEKNLDLLDHYDTVIDTYKEIADLLGTDTLGLGNEVAIQYENAKLQNYQAAASAAKDNYDAVQKQLAEAQELLAKATTEAEKEQAQEYLDTVTETLQEAEEEYLSRWQSALEQAEEMYKNSLERNTNAYKNALGGGSANLDMLQEEIDRQKTINELHLEDYEKYKRLGDLSEDINQSLSKNPNIKIQTKLNDLLDDVNEKMAEGVEISDGEATILEKRLALLQAEDQLQTARNSKSAVRLTRDNEGNFSYTYTADTDAIEEAEQNYADKFYDLLDYERDYSEEVQDSLLSSWQDFIDKRNDILEDDMLSESERNEALAKLKDDYDTIVGYYTDQLQFVTDEMGRLKTEDWKDIEETIGRLVATDGDFETSFSDTLLGQMVGADYTTAADALRAWQAAADECYKADSEAYQTWQTNKETINNAVDSSTKTFASDYTSTMQDLATTSQNVAESAKEAAEEMVTSMEGIYESAEKTFTQYNSWLSDLLENINKLTVAINNLKTAQAGDIDATVSSAVTSGQTFLNNTAKDSSWTSDISHFDTGGYTGSWGDSGKLSVLHQKELVLNQDDTSNLLSTISLVKEIVGNFSNNFTDVASRLNYGVLNNVGTGSLDQNVQIQASFPNVVDHNEIELALNNLVNSASQYVNKK